MRPTLTSILEVTRERVAGLQARSRDLEAAAAAAAAVPGFAEALRGASDVAVIAEVKRRSPSAGPIAPDLDPVRHAAGYEKGGARAVSVLTEAPHFGGSLDDLVAVRRAIAAPVLRKDFILDPVQLFESRAAGASAVLLIVRALGDGQLQELAAVAADLGLARLVEVHAREELQRAVDVDPEVVGVNSRDLDTFDVDLERAAPLLAEIPPGLIAVAESGIAARDDVERLAALGADAILVGTVLAREHDPVAGVRRFTGVRRGDRGRAVQPAPEETS